VPQTLSAFSSYVRWLHKSYYINLKIFIFRPLALTILPHQKAAYSGNRRGTVQLGLVYKKSRCNTLTYFAENLKLCFAGHGGVRPLV